MKKVSPIKLAAYSGFSLVLVYLFYYLNRVDVSLTYFWQQSIPISVSESLRIPGGLSALLADLMLEATIRPVFGSILFALLLTVVFFSLKTIFRKESGKPLFYPLLIASLIPFIFSFSQYRLPFELITSVAAGLLMGVLYSYCLPRKLGPGLLCSFLAAILVFVVAGIPGLTVLLQVLIIQALLSGRYKDLIFLIPILILPLLYLPFNLAVSVKQAYLGSFLVSEYDEIPRAFYFSLTSPLLLLMGLLILNSVFSKLAPKPSLFVSSVALVMVLVVLGYSTNTSFDEAEKNGYAIVQASFDKDWDKVFELTKEASSYNNLVQFIVNRALNGTGILLDEMFRYPQLFGETGIFLDGFASSQISIHTAAFYYDLGFANETRHWATEAQMVLVRHPIVLKQLVMSYIAIGQEGTALTYLRVLSGSRLYREWSDHVFMMLKNNEAGEDPDIRFFRSNNPDKDFFAGTKDPVKKLAFFYRYNKDNNMAFELLLAGYLLKHNIGAVVFLLPEFRNQGFEKFPIAVEEALMIYLARTGTSLSSLTDYSISKSTLERFNDFSKLIANVDSQAERMKRVSKYKNTYWYYILFSSPYASKK